MDCADMSGPLWVDPCCSRRGRSAIFDQLARFEARLRQFRPLYLFYVHKPRYAQETFDKRFPDIVLYFKLRILAQFSGTEP